VLNLVLNGESLVRPLTGIGQYTRALVQHLGRADTVDSLRCFRGNRLVAGHTALSQLDQSEARGGRFAEIFMGILHGVASRTLWPYRAHKRAGDEAFRHAVRRLPKGTLYHEPNYVLKPYDGPSVVTIHDLSIILFPQHHPKARVDYIGRHMERSVHEAERVITDSDVVRGEVIEYFGVEPSKVVTIHLGVDPDFRPMNTELAESVLGPYGIKAGHYILSVSTLEPRKNLEALVEAFRSLDVAVRKRFPLVIVGARGWHSESLERQLDQLVARGEARRLGYVARPALPALFSSCRLFVFPSLYEGFGLPVLEAMACGSPVLTSTGTSMEEFACDAACFCDPTDVASIADGMLMLLEDEKRLDQMSALGRQVSAALTWERCAQRHLSLYHSATDGGL